MDPQIKTFNSLDDACIDLANFIADTATSSIKKRGRFTMALSGGSTPIALHKTLAQSPFKEKIDWPHTHLFWGDERWLPLSDLDSNFAMAKATLLKHVDVPANNIYPMPTPLADPATGAADYEKTLQKAFSTDMSGLFPVFDIILLGMGVDGHTASLFPEHAALYVTDRWVIDVTSSYASPQVPRLTLTLPVINHARNVIFLITGEAKKKIMNDIIENPDTSLVKYPSAHVRPIQEKLFWYHSK